MYPQFLHLARDAFGVPNASAGPLSFFDVLEMSSGLNILATFRVLFGKNSSFSNTESKLLQKFGQMLSTVV